MKNRIIKFLGCLDLELILEGLFLISSFMIIGVFIYCLDNCSKEIHKKVVSMEVVDKYVVEGHLDCSSNVSRICSYVDDVYTLKVKSIYEDNSIKEEIKEINEEYYSKINVGDVLDNGIIK